MADWDSEDFVIPNSTPPAITDKWEGEDEEEPVKDSWEDEDSEKSEKSDEEQEKVPVAVKKKKKLQTILAEKEKEAERKRKEKEEQMRTLTPEEKYAEKLRIQKAQEEGDLALVTDFMGLKDKNEKESASLDSCTLDSAEDLENFRIALINKIQTKEKLERKSYYVTFLEDLCRSLCQNIDVEDIKRVTTVLNALYNEKVKATKATKGKKKGSSKAKLNAGQGAIADTVGTYGYDEYDDFI